MKLSLQWKWFVSLAGLLVVLVFVVNVCIDIFLPPYLIEKIRADLERDAVMASEVFRRVNPDEVNTLAHQLSRDTGLRVTTPSLGVTHS